MSFDDLSPELQEKAKACTSSEELNALAESEGFELSDDDLQAVAGGTVSDDCPYNSCFEEECYTNECDEYQCHTFACYDVACKRLACDAFVR